MPRSNERGLSALAGALIPAADSLQPERRPSGKSARSPAIRAELPLVEPGDRPVQPSTPNGEKKICCMTTRRDETTPGRWSASPPGLVNF